MNPAPPARPVIVLVPTRGAIWAELGRALIQNTPGSDPYVFWIDSVNQATRS